MFTNYGRNEAMINQEICKMMQNQFSKDIITDMELVLDLVLKTSNVKLQKNFPCLIINENQLTIMKMFP